MDLKNIGGASIEFRKNWGGPPVRTGLYIGCGTYLILDLQFII